MSEKRKGGEWGLGEKRKRKKEKKQKKQKRGKGEKRKSRRKERRKEEEEKEEKEGKIQDHKPLQLPSQICIQSRGYRRHRWNRNRRRTSFP